MGKFAQLGNRLIDSTAKKLSAQFFENFGAIVEGQGESGSDEKALDPAPSDKKASFIGSPLFWSILAGLVALIVILQFI